MSNFPAEPYPVDGRQGAHPPAPPEPAWVLPTRGLTVRSWCRSLCLPAQGGPKPLRTS
jgi:hypothetical protein